MPCDWFIKQAPYVFESINKSAECAQEGPKKNFKWQS